jgi:murein L,D-transpeptidase YcbB/YkuD
VERFQEDKKMKADGVFGRKTRGALYRTLLRQIEAAEKAKAAKAKKTKKKAKRSK